MERPPIAFESANSGAVIPPPDVRHTAATYVNQVFRRQPADFFVVDPNEVSRQPGQVAIDKDVWSSLTVHSFELLDVGSGRRDDQSIQTAREQPRNFLLLELRILLRGGHDQRVAFVPNCVGEGSGNLGKEWVKQAGSDQTNQIATSRDQAAGERVGLVIQLFDPLQHPLPGLLTDIGMLPQDF